MDCLPIEGIPVSDTSEFAELYKDLHQHPELGFQEHRTAAIVADRLAALGFDVTTGIGGTGVVGLLANGPGRTVLARADMDALPVQEQTGLPYASTARQATADGQEVPVMHACGHDMHTAMLLGVCARVAGAPATWSGTLMVVFQPAEELLSGARTMIAHGLYERFRAPDVVLAQHIVPFPAGTIGIAPGPTWAATDGIRVTLHGRGSHGSQPQAAVDPVVMAASVIMRLQTVVSREIAATELAVVTIGYVRSGTKENVIPDSAELGINVRSLDPGVRTRVLAAITRVVEAESAASGAPKPPQIETLYSVPVVFNEPEATERTVAALGEVAEVFDPGPLMGSEDVGELALAAGAPMVLWEVGCADPEIFARVSSREEMLALMADQPVNHSPMFAPVIQPTLDIGIDAMSAAVTKWLPPQS